jgi:tetratricopeptide (TPR) repeat protein
MGLHPDQVRSQAYLRLYLAFLRALNAQLEEARGAAVVARAELEELGEEVGLHTSAAMYVGWIATLAEDWVEATDVFDRAVGYVRDRPPQRSWHAYFLARLGEAALEMGDAQGAADLADRSRATAVEVDAETEIWWRRVAARALSAQGHPRKAAVLGREAVVLSDGIDDLVLRGGARLDLAEVLLRAGSRTRASATALEGLASLDRKGAVLPATRGRLRFADLLDAADGGDAASAAPHRRPPQQLGGQ